MKDEENKEARLRAKCRREGILMRKSRKSISADNEGGFRLVDTSTNAVIDGSRFDMTLEDVENYLKGE